MNENAKRWVEELRSGRWKQGRERLHSDGKVCCLGVACELYAKGHPEWKRELGTDEVTYFYGPLEDAAQLPPEVRDWIGLRTREGHYRGCGEAGILTHLNDDDELTFPEIADVIEGEPEGLFKEDA